MKLPEISWKLPTGDISHVGIYSVVIWQHSSFSVFCPFYKVEEAMLLTSNLELLFISDPSFELKEDEDTDDTLESNSDPDSNFGQV